MRRFLASTPKAYLGVAMEANEVNLLASIFNFILNKYFNNIAYHSHPLK